MSTRTELRQLFKELLGMPNTDPATESGRPTNAQINSMLELYRKDLYGRMSSSFSGLFLKEGTLAYTASAESTALAAAQTRGQVQLVQYLTPGAHALDRYKLEYRSLEELAPYQAYGDPEFWHIQWNEGKIHLRPIPQSAGTVYVYYVPELTALGDSNSPTELPAGFHDVLAWGAVMRYQGKSGDPEYVALQQMVDATENSIRAFYGRAQPNTGIKHLRRR